MMGETWKGDKDNAPKFGRKARAWLRRQIDRKLRTVEAEWGNAPFAAVVDWYLDWDDEDQPGPFYVQWQDSEEFHGGRFSNGSWVVLWDTVMESLPDAISVAEREAQQNADAERFPTLDAWLMADIRGELKYRGRMGGMQNVPEEARERVKSAAREREARQPIVCECGESFKRDRRNARRCPKCRAVRKTEREKEPRQRNRGSNGKA